MIFRVKCSKYMQGGKRYLRGEEVESDRDLVAVFPGKFDLVMDSYNPTEPNVALISRSPLKAVEGGLTEPPSTVIKSKKAKSKEVKKEENVSDLSEWEDMTDEFQKASELGFKILYDGESYKIVDSASNKILNEEKVLSKSKEVRMFLKDFLEG